MLRGLYIRLSVMSAVVLAAVSCAPEGSETKPDAGYGTLGMTALKAIVSEEGVPQAATRAVETEDFIVRIMDAKQQVAGEWTVAACPPEVTLRVGDYTLEVCSPRLPDADWECPWYAGTESFTIADNDRTDVGNITCRMGNVKATVRYSEGMQEFLGEDVVVAVSVGNETMEFTRNETRAAYFRLPEGTNEMHVSLSGTIEGSYDTYNHVITGVKPGDWEMIRFTYEEADGYRTYYVCVGDFVVGQISVGTDWGIIN